QGMCLAIDHALHGFGIALALYMDFRCGGIDLAQIIGSKFDVRSAEVLLEAMDFGCAGDRDDPRLLSENPRKRDLRRRRMLFLREAADRVDEGLICLPVFR